MWAIGHVASRTREQSRPSAHLPMVRKPLGLGPVVTNSYPWDYVGVTRNGLKIVGKDSWSCPLPPLIGKQRATGEDSSCSWQLLQLRVFGLGLFQNGDVGVSVFPESEKILICRASVGRVVLRGKSAGEAELGQGPMKRKQLQCLPR